MKEEKVGLTSVMKVNLYHQNNTFLPSQVEISHQIGPTLSRSRRRRLDHRKLRQRRISMPRSRGLEVLAKRKRMECSQRILIRNSRLFKFTVETIQKVMMTGRADLTIISGERGNNRPIPVVLSPQEQ